jgi:hypothetical protein
VSLEVSDMSHKLKRFRGDVYSTVEQIGTQFHHEASCLDALHSRIDRIEQAQGNLINMRQSNQGGTNNDTESQLDMFRQVMLRMYRQK